MRKEIQQEQSTLGLSLRFLSDGSVMLKKGSTTIHKIGTIAEVRGRLVKDFTEDVVLNINLVQKTFSSWLREYQDLYNSEISLRSSSITSIKYKRVQVSLVEETLPVKASSSFASKESGLSREVPSSKKLLQLREYSTTTVKTSPSRIVGIVPFHRVPPSVTLKRLDNGSFEFEGLDRAHLLNVRPLTDILHLLKEKLRELESINSRGYINSTRLSAYPILSGYLPSYVEAPKKDLSSKTEEELIQILDDRLTLNEKRVLVVWFHSLFNLNMYSLLLDVLYRLGVGLSSTKLFEVLEGSNLSSLDKVQVSDLIMDLKTYVWKFYGGINPSVREALRQRGLTVSENLYCGFDTEYQNLDMGKNKILSAQWAVNSKIVLSLPHLVEYDLSNQNTLTGDIYPINKMWFEQEKILFKRLQSEIRGYIGQVRSKRFSSNDESLKRITHGLINKGIPYFIDNGKINFSFDRTSVKTYFKVLDLDKLDLAGLVKIGLNLESKDLGEDRKGLYSLLKDLNLDSNELGSLSGHPMSNFTNLVHPSGASTEIIDSLVESTEPKYYKGSSSRTLKGGFTSEPISLTTRRNFYVIGHLTQADLSLLSDFSEFKKDLDIVNKCMVTLGKSNIVKHGHNIIFRDTMLLAPGGKKSLASIGGMYGSHLGKITLSESQHQNMELLLKEAPQLFKDYALRDSLISLIHAGILEDAQFKLNKLGIPLTLSSLGLSNLRLHWKTAKYGGYQLSKDYLLGDSSKMPTPRGQFGVGRVGLFMNNYIANYKGGRNESFMLGTDDRTHWYDYDLTSAYTTAMCMLGDPNYDLARRISPSEIGVMTDFELLYSYTTIELEDFRFPAAVTYPSIPCNADDITTIYPLTGKAVLTGVEYLTALKQGCSMTITGGTLIPFRLKDGLPLEMMSDDARDAWRVGWDSYRSRAFAPLSVRDKALPSIFKDMPFRTVINDLQSERRKHPQGTISNLLYKEMGNSLYGCVTKGINHKVKFDIKTGRTVRMESNDISNPILASWITAFVRSLLGELLHKVDTLKGKVVSVTTDGFITDLPDLETLLLEASDTPEDTTKSSLSLLKEYRETRKLLSGDASALECRHEGKKLMSWTTRGQLSVDMNLKAMTGLQTHGLDLAATWDLMSSSGLGKTISFASTSLRSAIDIYKKGGHVTMSYRDQDFRVLYNNNRIVIEGEGEGFLSTRPVESIEEALTLRRYSQLVRSTPYQKTTSMGSINKYTSNLEIGVRTFLRDVLNSKNGLSMSSFSGYRELIDYVHEWVLSSGYKLKRALTSSYVSQLKMRSANKVIKPYGLPRVSSIISFFAYVKERFPTYDTSFLFKS
jgi:hypothetical protein